MAGIAKNENAAGGLLFQTFQENSTLILALGRLFHYFTNML
jgi:hypothetical protein